MKKITFTYSQNPYNHLPTCTRPTPNRQYVKLLKHIEANPGCSRAEAMAAVTGDQLYITYGVHTHQCEWAGITRKGLCEMYRDGRKVKYYITDLGRNLLRSIGC